MWNLTSRAMHQKSTDCFAESPKSFNKCVWTTRLRSPLAWLFLPSASCLFKYLILLPMRWSVTFFDSHFLQMDWWIVLLSWYVLGGRYCDLCYFCRSHCRPMFRQVDMLERTYQRKIHPRYISFFEVDEAHKISKFFRHDPAICALDKFLSANRSMVPLHCRYLYRVARYQRSC